MAVHDRASYTARDIFIKTNRTFGLTCDSFLSSEDFSRCDASRAVIRWHSFIDSYSYRYNFADSRAVIRWLRFTSDEHVIDPERHRRV